MTGIGGFPYIPTKKRRSAQSTFLRTTVFTGNDVPS